MRDDTKELKKIQSEALILLQARGSNDSIVRQQESVVIVNKTKTERKRFGRRDIAHC